MSDMELKFEKIFKIAVTALSMNGSYPFLIRNKLWIVHVSSVIGVNVYSFYLLCYSIFVHDIRKGNFTEACKNTAMLIICMNTSFKIFVLLYHQQSIKKLIHILDFDYELAKQFSKDEKEIVYGYAKKGILICKFWLLCASSGCAMFPVKAFILTALSFLNGGNELVPMFDFTFPDLIERNKDSFSTYIFVFALCFAFAFLATLIYIGFDPLIPIFTLHICGQLDLLSGRIKKALSKTAAVEEMEDNLKKIIKELQQLYRFMDCVQATFTHLNEFNMKTTTIVLPLIAFHVTEDIRENKFNYEFLILFFGATLHFLMPCYFSDILMERSEEFRQAIYSCGWENHPDKRIRQIVLFMLTRTTRPLGISTVFHTISLDTFSNMVKESYSLFNLMNAAWGK